jgi:magnesium transporter
LNNENLEKNKAATVRDVIQFDSELLENISTLVENRSHQSLLTIFSDLHHADIAEIINHLLPEQASYCFKLLNAETAGEVIIELDENIREKILESLEPKEIVEIVDELEADDATDIVSELSDIVAEHVLDNINIEDSKDVKKLLEYEEDTAGGIMNSDFLYVTDDATVKTAIKELRKNAEEIDHIYHIFVLDKSGKLLGIVFLKNLLINTLKTSITSIMEEDLIYVTPQTDQEEVASIMEKYDLVSIPVVDDNKIMLGRITIDDIVDVINEEASEDLQKVAGITDEEELSDSIYRISGTRLPWLMVSLFGGLINAMVLSKYEASIQENLIASFFVPIVMAMGGSSATQAAIVMVRGLSTKDILASEWTSKIFKEFRVAMLNGLACSIILLLSSHFIFGARYQFSFILSLALLSIILIATTLGAIVPMFFELLGIDPAIAAGPFVNAMNDLIGLSIYLTFITKLYSN